MTDRETHKTHARRAERARDFIVLTLGGAGLMTLLVISGSLGFVEGLTAALVLFAGALAYFVGSVPPVVSDATSVGAKPATGSRDPSIRSLIHALPFPAFYISEESRIQYSNRHLDEIFRIKHVEGALKSVIIRQPDVLAATDRVARTGASERVEFMAVDGEELWLAHLTSGPAPHSVFVVFEDRTAVHRAERARADFLANASHELRTPLTALAGFIETMRGPARDDRESWDGFLEIMHNQTDRMRHLVSDLLSLSRIEFSEHRPPDTVIDLSDVLSHTILALQPLAAERAIELSLSGLDQKVPVTANWDEIAQVVQNLVGNALKYSPKGETVSVSMGVSPSMAEAATSATANQSRSISAVLLQPRASSEAAAAWINVADSGQGIARQHLARLGERFYRADESRGGEIEGTGLGLAIVKHIMARHRGGLAVASREGEGATFGIWLPRVETETKTPTASVNG
ncbi:sensor histidine kinase [Henriciella litoralis]|uniref:sensor histidine kinase n=1 Tax=Henriciella litoralis TaxID=568102 RepID=UPI00146E0C55|nr:ATP-binding protein [Henriciella litoralis]